MDTAPDAHEHSQAHEQLFQVNHQRCGFPSGGCVRLAGNRAGRCHMTAGGEVEEIPRKVQVLAGVTEAAASTCGGPGGARCNRVV
jgi:hypothetical protein